ncbi:aminoglycoside 6-adenylyltransferase [Lachnospiraceae bacterium 29-84]
MAKGLWRNELPYAMDVINFALRPHVKRLLEWEIGIEHKKIA